MRIKINVTAYEAEVLDRKGERVYYATGKDIAVDLDVDKLVDMGVDTAKRIEAIKNSF